MPKLDNEFELAVETRLNTLVPLIDAQREAFKVDGAVVLKNVFDIDAIDALRRAVFEEATSTSTSKKIFTKPGGIGRYVSDVWVSEHSEVFRTFCRSTTVASIACFFLESRSARFLYDSWIVKYPGTIDPTPWHQDWGFLGNAVSLWVPLDPIPRSSSVEVIRGSHLWNRQFYEPWHEVEFAEMRTKLGGRIRNPDGSMPEPIPDFEQDRDRYEILSWCLEPTDCLILDPMAVHGAPGNLTQSSMARYTSRWSAPDARLSASGAAYYSKLDKTGYVETVLPDGTALLSDKGCPLISPAI